MRMSRRMALYAQGGAMSYTYTGTAVFEGDPAGDWKLTLKTGGTLIFNKLNTLVDIFAVGGGAGASVADDVPFDGCGSD